MRDGTGPWVCCCGWSSWCLRVGVAGVSYTVVVGVGLVLVGDGGKMFEADNYSLMTGPSARSIIARTEHT